MLCWKLFILCSFFIRLGWRMIGPWSGDGVFSLSLSLSLHVCISRCRYTVHFQSILLKYAVCIKHIIEKHLWRWRWMSVQNILFSRRSIPFSMFHFATTVFFHLLLFIFGWMLLFALQLKIYNICLFGCALLFATDWIHFFCS